MVQNSERFKLPKLHGSSLPLRLILYMTGICLLSLGTVLSARAMLGVNATASFSFVISELSGFPLGNVTMIFLGTYIVIQLFLTVRRDYLRILLQFPFSLLMSEMINLLMKWIPDARDSIIVRVFLVLLSIAVTSVGVVFTVRTNIAPTAPDGLADCAAQRWNKDFGLVKNVMDIFLVVCAVLYSLIAAHRLTGVGIGTVLSALLTGRGVHWFEKISKPFMKWVNYFD